MVRSDRYSRQHSVFLNVSLPLEQKEMEHVFRNHRNVCEIWAVFFNFNLEWIGEEMKNGD